MDSCRRVDGFVGVGSDLIQYDPRYQALFSYLLGRVVVTRTLEQANQLARILSYRYRVVTLDGDVVNPGGSMTGGSRKQSKTNLLGRNRQLEELETRLKDAETKVRQVQQTLDEINRRKQELEDKWEQVRKQGEERRLREQELRSREREWSLARQNVVQKKKKSWQRSGRCKSKKKLTVRSWKTSTGKSPRCKKSRKLLNNC